MVSPSWPSWWRHQSPQRAGVGRFHGAKAAVAAPAIRWTEGAAAGLRYRPQAGDTVCYHDARRAPLLAFHTDAIGGNIGPPAVQIGANHFEQVLLIDGTATQLEVDEDVVGNRRGLGQRVDVFGPGIDRTRKLFYVSEVAQGLNPARSCAGADHDEKLGRSPNLADTLEIVRRGDGALHQRDIVGALHDRTGCLEEVGNVDCADDGQ